MADVYKIRKFKEVVLAKKEQDKQIEKLTKDRDQWKQAAENLKRDHDGKHGELSLEKTEQGEQIKMLTDKLNQGNRKPRKDNKQLTLPVRRGDDPNGFLKITLLGISQNQPNFC